VICSVSKMCGDRSRVEPKNVSSEILF